MKQNRERWSEALAAGPELAAARRRLLGVTAPDRDAVIAEAVHGVDAAAIQAAAASIAARGAATVKEKANGILQWLSLTERSAPPNWATWRRYF